MGSGCSPCSKGDGYDDMDQPDPEVRRRQQAEAAERRQQSDDKRGLKSSSMSESRRKQEQLDQAEKERAQSNPSGEGGLRWQVS